MILKSLGIVVVTVSLIASMNTGNGMGQENKDSTLYYNQGIEILDTNNIQEALKEKETKTNTDFLIENESENKTESNSVDLVEIKEEPKEQEKWWTQEEEDLLTQLVWHECGSDSIPDEAQQLLVSVVLNQMNHPNFDGDTIKEVIYRPGNFSCASYLMTGTPTERCRENVIKVLSGEVVYPNDIVWMSSVPQCAWGTTVKIYKVFDTSPYKMYFCHYGNPV